MFDSLHYLTMYTALSDLLQGSPKPMNIEQETCCPSIKKNHRLFKQNPKKRRVRFDLSAADHAKCVLQKGYKTHQDKENEDHNTHAPPSATPMSASTQM
jgi:hypothetical protein